MSKELNLLAPVVVFAYNRVDHLKKSLRALEDNYYASESELFIFADGPKDNQDLEKVTQVREFLKSYQNSKNFKCVTLYISNINKGLAQSIIEGVSKIITLYGRIIVIEDDVLSSKYFLKYMNEALNKYSENMSISSISSFVPDIDIPKNYTQSIFLSMRPSSIAWGTWLERWRKVDWELKRYPYQKYNLLRRFKLNAWGNDVAGRLDRYKAGMNNSWAIRFTVSGILKKQYSVHPIISLTEHIGYDNSGTNSSNSDLKRFSIELVYNDQIEVPNKLPECNPDIKKEYQKKYKRSIISEIGEFVLIVLFNVKPESWLITLSKRISKKINRLNE